MAWLFSSAFHFELAVAMSLSNVFSVFFMVSSCKHLELGVGNVELVRRPYRRRTGLLRPARRSRSPWPRSRSLYFTYCLARRRFSSATKISLRMVCSVCTYVPCRYSSLAMTAASYVFWPGPPGWLVLTDHLLPVALLLQRRGVEPHEQVPLFHQRALRHDLDDRSRRARAGAGLHLAPQLDVLGAFDLALFDDHVVEQPALDPVENRLRFDVGPIGGDEIPGNAPHEHQGGHHQQHDDHGVALPRTAVANGRTLSKESCHLGSPRLIGGGLAEASGPPQSRRRESKGPPPWPL